MTDTCRVTRTSGAPVWDDATGEYTVPAGTVVYEGRCRLRATTGVTNQEQVVGEQELALVRRSLRLPVTDPAARAVRRGDTVTVTASNNPGLVGVVFTVMEPHDDSHGSARRLPVEAVV